MLLIFCKDGHIRYKNDLPDDRKFPLLNLEALYKTHYTGNMLGFWKNHWKNPIEFEEGLTFREFMLNLEPWVEIFQNIIPEAVNLNAFIQEVKKPFLMTTKEKMNYPDLCDYISINQVTSLIPIVFRKEKNNYLPINQTNGKYQSIFQIQMTGGYNDLRNDNFRIENYPLNILGNKPIYINRNHYFIVDRFNNDVSKHNNIPKSIFNENAYGSFEFNEVQDLIISERKICILDILTEAFQSFFSSPEERDFKMQQIREYFEDSSFEYLNEKFSQDDEAIQEELIKHNIIDDLKGQDQSDLIDEIEDDIQNTINATLEFNNLHSNIETKYSTIKIQKNAFSHLDFHAHQATTKKDIRLLNPVSEEKRKIGE